VWTTNCATNASSIYFNGVTVNLGGGNTHVFTGLQQFTAYTFTVSAGGNCGGGCFTDTRLTSLCAPTIVSLTQGTSPPLSPNITLAFSTSGAMPPSTQFHFFTRLRGEPTTETETGIPIPSNGSGTQYTTTFASDKYEREFAVASYVERDGITYSSAKSDWFLGWPAGTPIPPVASNDNLISPIGNLVCYGTPCRFIWRPADNARKWNLQVATDPSFTNPVYNATNITTSTPEGNWYQDVSNLQLKQLYYWRVQPSSALNETGAWTSPTSFTMGTLAVTFPINPTTWYVGSQEAVQWSPACGGGDKIELFPAPTIVGDHLTGTSMLLSTSAAGGQLQFAVPCMVSNQARIQITRILPGGVTEYAYSPAPITINLVPGNGNTVKNGAGVIAGPQGSLGQVSTASGNNGSTYVCWSDKSNGQNADVFVARLDGTGRPFAGWPVNVTPGIAGDQMEPQLLPDGSGGVAVCWADERNSTNYPDVYALRWNSAGATVSGWGAAAPGYGGIAIANAGYLQPHPSVARASDGALLVAWAGSPDFSHNYVYAQKLTAAGARVWAPSGVQVSESGSEQRASIVSDGQGGAYLSYVNMYGDAHLQHILAANGSRDWPLYSTVVTQSTLETPALVELGNGAVMMAYVTLTTPTTTDLWAYSYDPATESKLYLSLCNATGDQKAPAMVSDGSGGAIIAWRDTRSGSLGEYAARVLRNGNFAPGWPTNGLQVASAISVKDPLDMPALAPDANGGAVFAWRTSPGDISSRIVNYEGCVGAVTTVCNDPLEQSDPTVSLAALGSAVIAWRDARCSGIDTGVFAAALAVPYPSSGVNVNVHCQGAVSVDFSGSTDAVLGAPTYYDVRMSSAEITEGNFTGATQIYYGPSNNPLDETVSCSNPTYFACKARYGTCYWTRMGYSTWVIGNCSRYCADEFKATPSWPVLPAVLDLRAQPNPATYSVRVSLAIPSIRSGQALQLSVYDIRGRLVRNLEGGAATAGTHDVVWDATETDGSPARPGLYFLKLKCGDAMLRRQVILIR